MTPSTDNFAGVIALILFVIKSLWDIYREKNKPKIDNAQANHTQAQAELSEAQADKIKADIQRDVLAQVHLENQTLRETVERLSVELGNERKARKDDNERAMSMIAELQTTVREKDQTLFLLQDAMTERENNFNLEISKRDAVIAGLQLQITEEIAKRDEIIAGLQFQITELRRTQAEAKT
ncbi:MAG: hypothetical protein IPO08_20300 [Xanthomonadales bacterium]|nr:hypothetical protein [Xanthomonadales bacterium]